MANAKKPALSKSKTPARASNRAHVALQWTIWLLLGAMILTIESKSALGAYHVQLDHVSGVQMGILSLVCAIVAFIANAVAGSFKDDIRPHVKQRVWKARLVSALIIVPICFLGSSLKWDTVQREWLAYEGSPQMHADEIVVADMMADRYDREAARERLTRPSDPQLDLADGEFWIAAFFQTMLIVAADALRVPAKATKSEVAYWRRKAADERRQRREEEKKKRESAPKPRLVSSK